MTAITTEADYVWRDGPEGSPHYPLKSDIRAWARTVDSVAGSASEDADRAEAALAEIEDIAANAPDAPSIVNKVNRNGDNAEPEPFRESIESYARNVPGPTAPVQGSVAQIYAMFGEDASSAGGIHPNGKVYYGYSFKKTFTATDNPTPLAAPGYTVLAYAENASATGDIGAFMGQVVCTGPNTKGLAMNLIVGSTAAYANLKQEGLEIDVQPVAGSTVIDGFGIALNAFNVAMPISAILVGGVAGGSFANGMNVIGGITDSAVAATNGATMKSLINSGDANYTDDAIVLTQGDGVRLRGSGSNFGRIYGASGDNLLYVSGASGNHIFRNNGDVVSLAVINNDGVDVQVSGGAYRVAGTKVVGAREAAVADASPAAAVPTQTEFNALVTQFNALLDRCRSHGLIST